MIMKQIIAIIGMASILFFLNPFDIQKVKAALLVYGSTGERVEEIQYTLNQLGYLHTQPTGYYGPLTQGAAREFQQDFNLAIDGIVGPETQQALKNVEMMARVVHGEARGESYEGQVAVAAVIFNRVRDSEFPTNISDVIFQRNAFTAVSDGQYDLPPNQYAYQAVKDARLGWIHRMGLHITITRKPLRPLSFSRGSL